MAEIYYRLAGQSIALAVHGGNSLVMFLSMLDEELMKDPQIKTMTSMQGRYLTVWNIGFQLAYFSLAFICDFLTVTGRDHLIPKSIRNCREIFFSTVIWPLAWLIFIIFWSFFLTDRELLFPAFIDKIFSIRSNLVMHFFIAPAALWELLFLPRNIPKSHTRPLSIVVSLYTVYTAFIIYTHSKHGLWPYPVLKLVYGTIYFQLFLAIAFLLILACYFSQWKLTAIVWGNEKKRRVKKVK